MTLIENNAIQILDVEQGSNDWHKLRSLKIGSSDAPVIMGVGFDTPYQRWQQKIGLSKKDTSYAMQRGVDLEPIARDCFEKEVGVLVLPSVVLNLKRDWQIASLDGLDFTGKIAVEIKCAGKSDHEIALNGSVPDKYFPQLQHQMLVLNVDRMYYFSFDGSKGKVVEVKLDADYCSKLLDAEKQFYDSILNFEPPSLTHRDYIKKNDNDWLTLANRWINIRTQIEALEHEEKNCKNSLLHLANQQSAEGGGIRLQKVYRRGVVDYSKIPELKGVDLDLYRKPGSESFRLIEVK